MGTITMVASGKDGAGKSTVSVFMGAALAGKSESVLIIELDSGLRSIDVISGVYSNIIYDINDVLNGKCEPKKAIVKSPLAPKLYVMSAPFNSGSLDINRFVKLCTALSQEFDHVIIDTASAPGAIIAAASTAMRAIVVTTADPIGIRGSRLIVDRLFDLSVNSVRFIINRLVPERVAMGIVPNLDFCIDNIGARLLGVIPESNDIAVACAGVKLLKKDGTAAAVFSNIAERLNGNDVLLLIR